MQGKVTGPGQCSNQIENVIECIEESKLKYSYTYKEELGIPPLGMVDDMLAVSSCGSESVAMNAYLKQKTNIKRLQYGLDKCHHLHVGKDDSLCPEFFIDELKLVKKDELKNGIDNLIYIFSDEHKMDSVTDDKYL
jgi:hypothetical protein